MASKSYKVTGALATPYAQDGTRLYLYQGAAWPEGGLREGETERFLDLKYIAEIGNVGHVDPAPSKYDGLKADELKDEIGKRNDDGRNDDAKLPSTGNKADLIAALVADDNK